MSRRKPAGVSPETWVERLVRQAQERGDFDDLPFTGKPLPSRPIDDLWWVREKLRHERVEYLPPALEARRVRSDAMERIPAARSEAAVRRLVADANRRIRELNLAAAQGGPPTTAMPVDEDEALAAWRAAGADGSAAGGGATACD